MRAGMVVAALAVVAFWKRQAIKSGVENMTAGVSEQTLRDANVQAFLHLIRVGEGTTGPNGYRTLFGGALFTSYGQHPNVRVPFASTYSTAAGAYQILIHTWQGLQAKYGFADFSPHNQDLAAVALIKGRGALGDVLAGRFSDAIQKCNREWASLPNSPYGQPTLSMADAAGILQNQGVNFA